MKIPYVQLPGGGDTNPQKAFYEGMSRRSLVSSDFTETRSDAEGIVVVASGFFAGLGSNAGENLVNHPGVWRLATGIDADGRVFVIGRAPSYNVGGGGITRVGTWLKTPVELSTALEEYTLRTGFFGITLPNTIEQGIGFEYAFDQNGGRWQILTKDSSETSADSGITVAADTWYKMEFEVNTDASSVEFFIDNVSVGKITTNIPLGTGFNLYYNTHMMKFAGTTSRSFALDAYYIYQEITR